MTNRQDDARSTGRRPGETSATEGQIVIAEANKSGANTRSTHANFAGNVKEGKKFTEARSEGMTVKARSAETREQGRGEWGRKTVSVPYVSWVCKCQTQLKVMYEQTGVLPQEETCLIAHVLADS